MTNYAAKYATKLAEVYYWYASTLPERSREAWEGKFYQQIDMVHECMGDDDWKDVVCIYYSLTASNQNIVLIESGCDGKSAISSIRDAHGHRKDFVEFYLYIEDGVKQIFHKAPREKYMFTRK